MDNVPSKRRVVWQQDIDFCRSKFWCNHCGFQLWGAYQRIVLCVESRSTRYRSQLIVERHCNECM